MGDVVKRGVNGHGEVSKNPKNLGLESMGKDV
jgi:hypothetical protein